MNKLIIAVMMSLIFSVHSAWAMGNGSEKEESPGLAKGSENGKDNNPGQAKGSENGKDNNPGQANGSENGKESNPGLANGSENGKESNPGLANGSENGKESNPGLANGSENENAGPHEDSSAMDNADCNSSFKRELETCDDNSLGNNNDPEAVAEDEPEVVSGDEEMETAVAEEPEVNFEEETLLIPCLKVKNSEFDGVYKVELKMMDQGNAAMWTVEGAEFVSETMGECKKALNANSNSAEEGEEV